jgi:hypothetical protein
MKIELISDPPGNCDMCHSPVENVFIDGKTKLGGLWANMCLNCHKEIGMGLGTGKGQEWWRDPETGKFFKEDG